MSLPPGRNPMPVPGINATTDPELAKATGELAAWIDYLLHPESNDGPRIYRSRGPNRSGHLEEDAEMPRRMQNLDEQPSQYETVSVIDGYAADPGVFFRPAQAVSGVSESTINNTYVKLTEGCFTWSGLEPEASSDGPRKRLVNVRYPERHPARLNWMQMRKGWVGPQDHSAYVYEGNFIAFQVQTENGLYVVAEHLVRYRAIFKKAGEDITALMNALMEKFARAHPYSGNGVTFDLLSIVVTGLVVATTTVITGGAGTTVGVVLSAAAIEILGEAVKTAKSNGTETKLLLENHFHLRDVAKQYLDGVNKIERDAAEAVKQLYESLRIELDKIRTARQYEVEPDSGNRSTSVPEFRDYL